MAYFRETLKTLQAMREAANGIRPSGTSAPSSATAHGAQVSPRVVAAALAEAFKSDNSDTQAIAIRAANLAARYSHKAA